jgi:hypothetical protein
MASSDSDVYTSLAKHHTYELARLMQLEDHETAESASICVGHREQQPGKKFRRDPERLECVLSPERLKVQTKYTWDESMKMTVLAVADDDLPPMQSSSYFRRHPQQQQPPPPQQRHHLQQKDAPHKTKISGCDNHTTPGKKRNNPDEKDKKGKKDTGSKKAKAHKRNPEKARKVDNRKEADSGRNLDRTRGIWYQELFWANGNSAIIGTTMESCGSEKDSTQVPQPQSRRLGSKKEQRERRDKRDKKRQRREQRAARAELVALVERDREDALPLPLQRRREREIESTKKATRRIPLDTTAKLAAFDRTFDGYGVPFTEEQLAADVQNNNYSSQRAISLVSAQVARMRVNGEPSFFTFRSCTLPVGDVCISEVGGKGIVAVAQVVACPRIDMTSMAGMVETHKQSSGLDGRTWKFRIEMQNIRFVDPPVPVLFAPWNQSRAGGDSRCYTAKGAGQSIFTVHRFPRDLAAAGHRQRLFIPAQLFLQSAHDL